MVAEVERLLKASNHAGLQGLKVLVYGIGPVGVCTAVLAAGAGAQVTIASHNSEVRARSVAAMCQARFGAIMRGVCAADSEQKRSILADCQVLLACGKVGVRLFSRDELGSAGQLLVAADVNAVPPEGVEGVGAMDRGTALLAGSGRALGVGALAIGNIKFKVQRGLFEKMRSAERPVYFDFRDAFRLARELAS
jgi:methylene-tetrahydromethanopterin dehydrogenase